MFSWRQHFALTVTDIPVNTILTILSAHPLRIIAYMTRVQSLWSYMASHTVFQDSSQRVRTIGLEVIAAMKTGMKNNLFIK